MFLEYWGRPEATREKFIGDWMTTGDQGMVDEDGYFHFVGRDDDVITSSGYRIWPGEIENCLIKHPAVALAAGFLCLAFAGGCGGQPKAQVSGLVTLDGVPIENGTIQFYPVGGSGQTAGGGIENGKYRLDASVGEMTVTINASIGTASADSTA